jgi:hypothetical protein
MKTLDKVFNATLIFAVILVCLLHAHTAGAQQATFRDSGGRTTGTASTDSGGQTTYRDDRGRTTGAATVDSAGTTTFRDSSGRTVGTATAPRRW